VRAVGAADGVGKGAACADFRGGGFDGGGGDGRGGGERDGGEVPRGGRGGEVWWLVE